MNARFRASLLGAALAVGFTAVPANAVVIVNATVTATVGGDFHYAVSITNDELYDLAIVSITDAPLADPLIDPSLVAPVGFLASYDGGLGFIDFIEDTSPFLAGTTTSGFEFVSSYGPEAYFTEFAVLTSLGQTITGSITVDAPSSSVPEPGAALLLGLGLAGLRHARRRDSN